MNATATSVPLLVVNMYDPMISASQITKGCSDNKLFSGVDAGCLGYPATQRTSIGKLLIIIGSVLLVVELISLIIVTFTYIYRKRRVNPRILMSNSLEDIFTPYSLDELILMHSPHVDEIRELQESSI